MDQIPAPPSPAEFDHYGISVTDLGPSLDFYCGILGGVVVLPPHSVDEFSFRRAVIWLNIFIDLNEHTMNTGEAFDPVHTGLDHLAFRVSSYDALVAWAHHLDAKGVACSPIRVVEGVGEAFDFRDPDRIQIEYWHQDPGGQWASYVKRRLEEVTGTAPLIAGATGNQRHERRADAADEHL